MQRSLCWILIGVLTAIAIGRVVATYPVFNHTYDEPTHIRAGLQLLDTGEYIGDEETPPLARVVLAIGPYLYGAKPPATWAREAALTVLYDSKSYDTTLTLGRLGNILFLVLLVVGTGLWTIRLFGARAAVLAVAALTMLPAVLGHAGIATTDVACAATVLLALYAFMRWIETGSWRWAILFALGGGGAIMVKFSAIPYLAVCVVAIFLWRFVISGETAPGSRLWRTTGVQLAAISCIALCIFWLSYGLLDPLGTAVIHDKFDSGTLQNSVARVVGKDTVAFKAVRTVLSEVPFPLFVRGMIVGLIKLGQHNENGHSSYLLGEVRHSGWWYYYLVALFYKTPIPFLLLGLAASVFAIWRSLVNRNWSLAVPILCAVAIVVFTSVISRLNIGVRHLLIVYPFVTVAVGGLVDRLWIQGRRVALAVSSLLFIWLAAGSIAVHPDYLASFNLFADDRPERILIDSDLDWGQGLKRLRQAVEDRNIDRITVAYYGTADLERHVPNAVALQDGKQATGWVAASIGRLTRDPTLRWLADRKPVARIGRTINLYYIKP